MSAPSSEPAEADRAPSYETARATHPEVVLTHDAQRLFWTLSGSLTRPISVMEDKWHDPDVPLEPYCIQTEPSPIWHLIAQSALSEPNISYVTVAVEQLDKWEEAWWELRLDNDDIFPVGTVADSDEDEGDDSNEGETDYPNSNDQKRVLQSCYQGMPWDVKASLDVKATGLFVTIHDYASGDLLDNIPLPGDTRLVVDVFPSPNCVSAVEEEEWKGVRDKKKHETDQHEAYM
ncbi:hypothetical protein Ptr902_12343 [Pyrenophora tritici-repentis]|nr:hypothetical protein Ptr902_12343 [Pyrenophora tritici-repentis]